MRCGKRMKYEVKKGEKERRDGFFFLKKGGTEREIKGEGRVQERSDRGMERLPGEREEKLL